MAYVSDESQLSDFDNKHKGTKKFDLIVDIKIILNDTN